MQSVFTQHYLSFHPDGGFWLPLGKALEMAKNGQKLLPYSKGHYEGLLKGPLISLDKTNVVKNMPAMKQQLEKQWIEQLERAGANLQK